MDKPSKAHKAGNHSVLCLDISSSMYDMRLPPSKRMTPKIGPCGIRYFLDLSCTVRHWKNLSIANIKMLKVVNK